MNPISKILTIGEGRKLKKHEAVAAKINALESAMQALSDEELAALTQAFRARHAVGESLDALLPEAFAAVREASFRTLGLRHFDVQLIGGMALHSGQIAEMRTGEGKTLVAALAGYLNAIPGAGRTCSNSSTTQITPFRIVSVVSFSRLQVASRLPQLARRLPFMAENVAIDVFRSRDASHSW